jgi:hypothetical protein
MTGAKAICSWIHANPCEVDLAMEVQIVAAEFWRESAQRTISRCAVLPRSVPAVGTGFNHAHAAPATPGGIPPRVQHRI